jgi:hypothetical protein
MRELTGEEKERLHAKIQKERKRQHEIIIETARESDKENIEKRRRREDLRELFDVMEKPGLSFKRRSIWILRLLIRILLPIIAIIVIRIIVRSLISKS